MNYQKPELAKGFTDWEFESIPYDETDIEELERDIEGCQWVIDDIKFQLELKEISQDYADNIISKEQMRIEKKKQIIKDINKKGTTF